jgi:hypothetical protein
MVQLPQTGDIALVSKLLSRDYSGGGADPTHFRVDCTYYNIADATFDYHQNIVYGYMDADWLPTTVDQAKWLVKDFLEFDNDLECSDYLHDVDYTVRRLMFVCNEMADGLEVTGSSAAVFVDYRFVYGAAPEIVQFVSEAGWDRKYPDYAEEIEQVEVVAGSLPSISDSSDADYLAYNAKDNGIWDRENEAMWLSGDQPQFCKFDSEFVARYDQSVGAWSSSTTAASSPFLRLAFTVVDHPNVMLWTYVIDGHEILVVPLQEETLVYDFLSEQWYCWGNGDTPQWAPQVGQNWNANLGNVISALGGDRVSNVICGDRQTSALYFLDPELNEDYSDMGVSSQPFTRIITGQLVSRTANYKPLTAVEVTASDGETVTSSNLTVKLEYSDDRGHTYTSYGTQTVALGTYGAVLTWRSLGGYRTPGRLLRLTDYGALVRVDDWTVPDDETPNGR